MVEFIEFNVPLGLRGKRRGRSARRHLAALLPTVAQLFRPDNVLCSRDVFVGRAFSAIHWVSSPVPLSYQPKTPLQHPRKLGRVFRSPFPPQSLSRTSVNSTGRVDPLGEPQSLDVPRGFGTRYNTRET